MPLPPLMRLIKGPKAKREDPRNEERFRFPAVEETWEVVCVSREDSDEQAPRIRKADPKAGLYDIAS